MSILKEVSTGVDKDWGPEDERTHGWMDIVESWMEKMNEHGRR